MDNKRKHVLPMPQKKQEDAVDVVWGGVTGAYETQAISDASHRQSQTRVALPSDACVKENKDWVDFNEK